MILLEELKKQRDEIDKKIKEIEIDNKKDVLVKLKEKYVGKTFLDFDGTSETFYHVQKVLSPYKLLCIELFCNDVGYHAISEFEEINIATIKNNCVVVDFKIFYEELKNTKNYVDNIISRKEWMI